jgi:hypothetical protein
MLKTVTINLVELAAGRAPSASSDAPNWRICFPAEVAI